MAGLSGRFFFKTRINHRVKGEKGTRKVEILTVYPNPPHLSPPPKKHARRNDCAGGQQQISLIELIEYPFFYHFKICLIKKQNKNKYLPHLSTLSTVFSPYPPLPFQSQGIDSYCITLLFQITDVFGLFGIPSSCVHMSASQTVGLDYGINNKKNPELSAF